MLLWLLSELPLAHAVPRMKSLQSEPRQIHHKTGGLNSSPGTKKPCYIHGQCWVSGFCRRLQNLLFFWHALYHFYWQNRSGILCTNSSLKYDICQLSQAKFGFKTWANSAMRSFYSDFNFAWTDFSTSVIYTAFV